MSDLAVWTDGEDWVIADSSEDATAICADLYGEYEGEGEWRKLPNDKLIRVSGEDEPTIEVTCGEWIFATDAGICAARTTEEREK